MTTPTECPFTDRILREWWSGTSEQTRHYCRHSRSDLDQVSLLWCLFDARIDDVTTDTERLVTLIREALERGERAEGNYRFMVERAADKKLDGYRELGQRAADAENQRDQAIRERDEARVEVERLRVAAAAAIAYADALIAELDRTKEKGMEKQDYQGPRILDLGEMARREREQERVDSNPTLQRIATERTAAPSPPAEPAPVFRETERGFKRLDFTDDHGAKCSLQESSAVGGFIWLGIDKPEVVECGWHPDFPARARPVELGEQFRIHGRMHLSHEQAALVVGGLMQLLEPEQVVGAMGEETIEAVAHKASWSKRTQPVFRALLKARDEALADIAHHKHVAETAIEREEKAIARVRELEAHQFSVARAVGIVHAPSVGPDYAGPDDVVLGEVIALKKRCEKAEEELDGYRQGWQPIADLPKVRTRTVVLYGDGVVGRMHPSEGEDSVAIVRSWATHFIFAPEWS